MAGELERIREIEYEIKKLQEAYVDEGAVLSRQRGFDVNSPKWQKKISKLADKYADLIFPLSEEHEELRGIVNAEAEAVRKSKYKKPD